MKIFSRGSRVAVMILAVMAFVFCPAQARGESNEGWLAMLAKQAEETPETHEGQNSWGNYTIPPRHTVPLPTHTIEGVGGIFQLQDSSIRT